jgi:DNA-binding transcriptional MerR regulator
LCKFFIDVFYRSIFDLVRDFMKDEAFSQQDRTDEDKNKMAKSKPNEPSTAEPTSWMARFPVLLVLLCCRPMMKNARFSPWIGQAGRMVLTPQKISFDPHVTWCPRVQSSRGGHGGPRGEKTMAYTVKKVAAMSGVSVRTLHFYDEVGLLKPAHLGANGYRFYEEPQLLTLQQILFYRELGFELKQIKQILGRADFEKVAALQSHRKVLQKNLTRTRKLIETIDKTIQHLKGTKKMKNKEMFAGFSVVAGDDWRNRLTPFAGYLAPTGCVF